MNPARTLLLLSACAIAGARGHAQVAPKWESHVVSEPDGATVTELSLLGVYRTPPSIVKAQPVMVVQCANGKVLNSYFSFGAVLSQYAAGLHPVELELYLDNVRRPIFSDSLNEDGTSAYFSHKELKRILAVHELRVGAVEFAGPQMQATFILPDITPVLAACGEDSILKRK